MATNLPTKRVFCLFVQNAHLALHRAYMSTKKVLAHLSRSLYVGHGRTHLNRQGAHVAHSYLRLQPKLPIRLGLLRRHPDNNEARRLN